MEDMPALRAEIARKRLTLKEVAKAISMNERQFSYKLKERAFKVDEIKQILEFLELEFKDIAQ